MNKEVLRKLGVTEGMIRHLELDNLYHPFGYRCQPAFYWRSSPIADRGIVAIWECGLLVNYFNPSNGRFERCSLENIDEARCSYSSLQGLLAELFLEAFEDEMDEVSLREHAKLFGFLNVELMLTEIKVVEDYNQWREQFPITCTEK